MSDRRELNSKDHEALAEIDQNTDPRKRTEYAVVYFQYGERVAEGPIPWEVAEDKANRHSGVVVHRMVHYTPWEVSGA